MESLPHPHLPPLPLPCSGGQRVSPEEKQLRAMQAAVLQARQAAQEMQAHLGGRPVTEVTDVREALQVRICRG